MNRSLRFTCPICGKRLIARPEYAGRKTACRACGQYVRVVSSEGVIRQGLLPPALDARLNAPAPFPAPPLSAAPSGGRRPWLLGGGVVLVALLLLAGLGGLLELNRQAAAEEEANETVAGKIKLARAHIQHREWDGAARVLEEALATEDATELDQARNLLGKVQRSRAQDLLAAARLALRRKHAVQARKLFQQYIACPDATDRDGARRQLRQLEAATSARKALALLQQLPEPALTAFVQNGRLAVLDRIQDPGLRGVYADTLRKNLPRAQQLRAEAGARGERARRAREAARRRAEEQRLARLKQTPVYRELTEFVARTRNRDAANRRAMESFDKQLLDASALLLGNNAGQNREAIKQRLAQVKQKQEQEQKDIAGWTERVDEQVSRLRANVKERIRTYRGLDRDDWTTFDRLVDEQLDRLLKDVQKPYEEDLKDDL
jgi:hypothetical protein